MKIMTVKRYPDRLQIHIKLYFLTTQKTLSTERKHIVEIAQQLLSIFDLINFLECIYMCSNNDYL